MTALDPRSTEDCLKLNVYSPELPSDSNPDPNMPVMFYIHGGAFTNRAGNIDQFGPQFMMDYGVVLVIADYRYPNINALSFYRSQKVLGWSNFFVPDQKFIYILWQSQTFCARQKDDLHSVKLVFVSAQKFLKRH